MNKMVNKAVKKAIKNDRKRRSSDDSSEGSLAAFESMDVEDFDYSQMDKMVITEDGEIIVWNGGQDEKSKVDVPDETKLGNPVKEQNVFNSWN